MTEIERIIDENRFYPSLVHAIEQYVIKAREEVKGFVIKKYIMTLPMDIRRAIMKYDSERIAELKKGVGSERNS